VDVVIDAHLINGLYRETVVGEAPSHTGSAAALFDGLGNTDRAFVDSKGRIEREWERVVDRDWFAAWFPERLAADEVRIIDAPDCRELIKRLATKCGFPARSGDRWYISTARAAIETSGECLNLVSEDLDLYEPRAKQGSSKQRSKVLEAEDGCVARILRKEEGIVARTVCGHLRDRGAQTEA